MSSILTQIAANPWQMVVYVLGTVALCLALANITGIIRDNPRDKRHG